ncbi:hypothetical protein HMPREF0577_2124 [Mobiluncus mulieris ATCC 35243]|nr:hypothetical protein HMPREF0577_2124 [Mobiluncus mulieris ATCC 35243]
MPVRASGFHGRIHEVPFEFSANVCRIRVSRHQDNALNWG